MIGRITLHDTKHTPGQVKQVGHGNAPCHMIGDGSPMFDWPRPGGAK